MTNSPHRDAAARLAVAVRTTFLGQQVVILKLLQSERFILASGVASAGLDLESARAVLLPGVLALAVRKPDGSPFFDDSEWKAMTTQPQDDVLGLFITAMQLAGFADFLGAGTQHG